MRFKIDENLHPEIAQLLRWHAHDATTVWEQGLRGKTDSEIAQVCRVEKRAIITLDMGFADIRTYPPEEHQGIVVLRLRTQSRANVLRVIGSLLAQLADRQMCGRLWIADETSIRVHGEDTGSQRV